MVAVALLLLLFVKSPTSVRREQRTTVELDGSPHGSVYFVVVDNPIIVVIIIVVVVGGLVVPRHWILVPKTLFQEFTSDRYRTRKLGAKKLHSPSSCSSLPLCTTGPDKNCTITKPPCLLVEFCHCCSNYSNSPPRAITIKNNSSSVVMLIP